MTRILAALASALALTGCMTQMPESVYQVIATRVAQASICKREQMMGVDQFNHYVVFQTRTIQASICMITVIFIGLMTYAIRGLYWAILDTCNIPLRIWRPNVRCRT